MKIPFKIGDKEFLLEPYKTSQEKDILISSSFEIDDFDRIFEIINFSTEHELSDDEKRVILLKHRGISLGDVVDIKFKCDHCGQGNETSLDIANFVNECTRNDKDIRKINKDVTDDNLADFLIGDIDVDELDLDEFDKLKARVIENQVKIDFTKSSKCLKCSGEKEFDLSSSSYIIEIMSDDTLMTLYKSYNFLTFFGEYSKLDIDSMYPFERSIFINLLNKTKEDLSK